MLLVIPVSDSSRHADLMERVFRFRRDIFVDGKGWSELRQPDGLERDRFDDEHAIHHVCLRDDVIVGYQRFRMEIDVRGVWSAAFCTAPRRSLNCSAPWARHRHERDLTKGGGSLWLNPSQVSTARASTARPRDRIFCLAPIANSCWSPDCPLRSEFSWC